MSNTVVLLILLLMRLFGQEEKSLIDLRNLSSMILALLFDVADTDDLGVSLSMLPLMLSVCIARPQKHSSGVL